LPARVAAPAGGGVPEGPRLDLVARDHRVEAPRPARDQSALGFGHERLGDAAAPALRQDGQPI